MYRHILILWVFVVAFDISLKAQTSEMCIKTQPLPSLPTDYGNLDVQTSVVIKADFAANGTIENIRLIVDNYSPLSSLAVDAAKKLTFQPRLVDGKPTTDSKTLEYYYSWQYSGWRIPRLKSLRYCAAEKLAKIEVSYDLR